MKTKKTTLACLLLAGGLSLNVAAQGGGRLAGPPGEGPGGPDGDPGGMPQMFLMRIVNNPKTAEKLGLSEAQIQTLRTGVFDLQEQKARVKADMEVASIQQARLLTEATIDEKAVMAAVEKTGAVRTEMAKLNIRGLLLVNHTLTAEQRDKLREMMHARMERGASGRGGPEGRGQRGEKGSGMHHRPEGGPGHGPEGDEPSPGETPPPGEVVE